MRGSFAISAVLHALIILLLIFGLPFLSPPPPDLGATASVPVAIVRPNELPSLGDFGVPEPEVTVDILSMTDSERITEIQTRLTELGYEPGPVDGVMGSRTRGAIEAFERDIGREPAGQPSNYIVAALRLASLQLGVNGSGQ